MTKLKTSELEAIQTLIFNNNQFSDTDEEKNYWDNIMNKLDEMLVEGYVVDYKQAGLIK